MVRGVNGCKASIAGLSAQLELGFRASMGREGVEVEVNRAGFLALDGSGCRRALFPISETKRRKNGLRRIDNFTGYCRQYCRHNGSRVYLFGNKSQTSRDWKWAGYVVKDSVTDTQSRMANQVESSGPSRKSACCAQYSTVNTPDKGPCLQL